MAKFVLNYSFSGSIEYEAEDIDEASEYFDSFSNDELLEMLDDDCLDDYNIDNIDDES